MKGRADWAWEIWSKGDEIGNRALGVWREDDYYVGTFADKGEAKRRPRGTRGRTGTATAAARVAAAGGAEP